MNQYTVGRNQTCDITPDGDISTISTRHLCISVLPERGSYALQDLGSTNGSFIWRNGRWCRFSSTTCMAKDFVMLGQYQTTVERLLAMARPQSPAPRGHSVRAEDGHITYVKRHNF